MRANPVENRNVFCLCLGMEGGDATEMVPAPRSQSSMCTRRDSLILSQTQGGKKKVPCYQLQILLLMEMIVKSYEHIETEKKCYLFVPEALFL